MKTILNDESMKKVSGGLIVDDGDGKRFWLVRQNGTVISPVDGIEDAKEFIKAFGESVRVISREEYKSIYGRELIW